MATTLTPFDPFAWLNNALQSLGLPPFLGSTYKPSGTGPAIGPQQGSSGGNAIIIEILLVVIGVVILGVGLVRLTGR